MSHADQVRGPASQLALADDSRSAVDNSAFLHCLGAKTGLHCWMYDLPRRLGK
jgi:hypothetical protein